MPNPKPLTLMLDPNLPLEWDFGRLVVKTQKENPDPADVAQVRQMLADHPDLWTLVSDLAQNNIHYLVTQVGGMAASILPLETGMRQMKAELGYTTAPPLERLLIDVILLNWLRLHWTEMQATYSMQPGVAEKNLSLWDKRLSRAQARYLKAVEALARVRRLKLPAGLQVNIAHDGGQQINILESTPEELSGTQ